MPTISSILHASSRPFRAMLRAPLWVKIAVPTTTIVVSYALVYLPVQTTTFAYSGDSCTSRWTIAPDTQKVAGDDVLSVDYRGGFSIGSWRVLSTQTCFTANKIMTAGDYHLSTAPLNGPLFRTNYLISVNAAPVIAGDTITSNALGKPLAFTLDKADTTFHYQLHIADKNIECIVTDIHVSCPLKDAALAQGQSYDYLLVRVFHDEQTTLVSQNIAILPAVTVTDSSIKSGQVIYDKPRSITIAIDKPATSAAVQLQTGDGAIIPTTVSVADTTIIVQFDADLEREKNFVLTVSTVEARDGSQLAEPVTRSFSTSGGPKVTGVSIGTSGVDNNARITIQLDQAVDPKADITKFAHITGGSATISTTGAQIVVQLNGLGRCSAFTLSIDKGLPGANGLLGPAAWSHTSRVICRSTATIGYSVQGRAIVAYYYGSGSTTILFTGGIHGSEPSGVSTMNGLISYLDDNAQNLPADRQVVVIPNTNPDGIAAGTRNNANNVNLDRNFPTANWQSSITSGNGYEASGGGSAPLSEPESAALAKITRSLAPRLEVSFHAKGSLVGANQYGNSTSLANSYASTVGYGSMVGQADETMGYTITGEYEDWMGEKLDTPAILIELPGNTGNYFSLQKNAIWKMITS